MNCEHVVVEFQMRDKHVGVKFQMSLKSMVWIRIISTGKLFDAMYTFVIATRSDA